MVSDRLSKYIWIVDTIREHGSLTRARLSDLWQKSHLSDGRPIPHRSFFHYRRAIEEQLGITISVNKAHEYYIEAGDSFQDQAFRSWMLDSYAMQGMIDDGRDVSSRIHIEPIPSARTHLSTVIKAIRDERAVRFTYAPFHRVYPEKDILFNPYFVKLFRQRWYMVGLRQKDKQVRTYALDRVTELQGTSTPFKMPESPTAQEYFSEIFGITQSQAPAQEIKIQTDTRTAKFLRALPLHISQKEDAFSSHSIFRYRMKLTDDLVRHILSMGAQVEVMEPPALRLMVKKQLKDTLHAYEKDNTNR